MVIITFIYAFNYPGTHDIQDITITAATSNRLCIRVDLVEGWTIEVAYIHLICDNSAMGDSSLSLSFSSVFSNTIYRCFSNVVVCSGNVLACEEEPQALCIGNPAAVTRVSLLPPPTTTSISISSTGKKLSIIATHTLSTKCSSDQQ